MSEHFGTKLNLEELNNLEWHDQPLDKILFNFSSKIITLTLSEYNESIQDYDVNEYWFDKVDYLNLDGIFSDKLDDFEINSKEVIIDNIGNPTIKLFILTGGRKQSVNLNFSFDSVIRVIL